MRRGLGFGSRVERNIVSVVLLIGLVPLALVAILAMHEIERETLELAERQLRDANKTYALDILEHIEQAAAEMRILHLSGMPDASARYVRDVAATLGEPRLERMVLSRAGDRLRLELPLGDVMLTGYVPFAVLFKELAQVPYGVRRCVELDGATFDCQGTSIGGARALSASWALPLASVYATDIELVVASRLLETVALEHVSLVVELLPLAVLLVAAGVGWYLILRIRRVVSPLAELQEATWSVRKGDYGHRVELNTGDEFERLGRAFNLMTARLGSSFQKMQALADIDRLILSGSAVEEVIRQALLVANAGCIDPCAVYLREDNVGPGRLFTLDGEGLQQVPLPLEEDEGPLAALAAALKAAVNATFEVRRNDKVVGMLLTTGHTALSQVEERTLAELADRVSVALTNAERAETLYQQANFDALTGLINRQAFTDRLQGALASAERRGHQCALLFLDLDRFKHVNDTEGHLVGDELLRVVGERLTRTLRTTDVIARLGGDEFAIVLPEVQGEGELTTFCERLIAAVCEPFELNGSTHNVAVSIGVAIYPHDGIDTGTLLMNSDVAMYKAKEQHGSAFAFFDESLNRATQRRVQIEGRLRAVLAEDRLELHFQPKLDLASGRLDQVEGLIRWPHDDDPLRPAEFVPIAEDTGLIHQFNRVLVRASAACVRRCDELGLELRRVAVNISSQQFVKPGLANALLEEMAAVNLRADRLELEITESVFVDDAKRVSTELKKLRAAGMRVVLDDFGTGYSSLNMLQTLPLDGIKIDRSFVTPLVESARARELAGRIVDIARLLNLEVVAEGVESEEELRVLRAIGCDVVQGFLLSPALPLGELVELLTDRQGTGTSSSAGVVPIRPR